jgi:hypothetical protein
MNYIFPLVFIVNIIFLTTLFHLEVMNQSGTEYFEQLCESLVMTNIRSWTAIPGRCCTR